MPNRSSLKNIPVKIKAEALPGFRFVKWQGISTSTSPEITLVLNTDAAVMAVFEPAPLSVSSVVINEINYHSSSLFDTEDWIELFNPVSGAMDLSGWKIRDGSLHEFILPAGSSIGGRSYLVLARDTAKFMSLRSSVRPIIGNISFGLSSEGELLQLADNTEQIVDEVAYSSTGSWSSLPNGTGATLALINPQMDNALPEQWKPSYPYGTPGGLNDVYVPTGIRRVAEHPSHGYELYNNYPNPFNSSTTIEFSLPEQSLVALTVYNQLGQKVRKLAGGMFGEGFHRVDFNAEPLASGMYFYELTTPKYRSIKKLILLK